MSGKTKTAVSQLSLGKTRVSGYLFYDHETMAFEETAPLEAKKLIKAGSVNGLKLEKGEVALDTKGYNMKDLTIRSGVGRYRLFSNPEKYAEDNLFYLTKMFDADGGIAYEVVSNLCARLIISEQALRNLYYKNQLSGLWIDDATETIKLSDGVEIVDLGDGNGSGTVPDGSKFNRREWDCITKQLQDDIAELAAAGDENMIHVDQQLRAGKEYDVLLIPHEYMEDIINGAKEYDPFDDETIFPKIDENSIFGVFEEGQQLDSFEGLLEGDELEEFLSGDTADEDHEEAETEDTETGSEKEPSQTEGIKAEEATEKAHKASKKDSKDQEKAKKKPTKGKNVKKKQQK